ncbi:MAG: glycosyltransferase [Bacteroidetes bacterium]|nr:glycosyltransferase [Bacteroidota bacterium]
MKFNLEHRNNKKSICIVCATPLTLHLFFREYIEKLSKNFDLTIIYNKNTDTYIDLTDLKVNVVFLPIRRKISLIFDFISLVKLINHFSKNHYDLVWGIAPKAGLLASLASFIAGIKIRLFIFQGEVWANSVGLRRSFFKIIDRLIAKLSTNLLAVSHGERQFLIDEGIVLDGQIQVLGQGSINGVNTSTFIRDEDTREEIRNKLGYANRSKVCIYLGRLNRDKGLIDLAIAFRNSKISGCQDLKLLIVGPDEEAIQGDICEAALPYANDITFLPFTKNPVSLLVASDLFCLPSYREGFPISILEAASCELPVIASSIYGIKDAIIDGETGRLFPKGDVYRLTELICDFYNHENDYRKMGINGRKRVIKFFQSDLIIDRYLNYIKSVINN